MKYEYDLILNPTVEDDARALAIADALNDEVKKVDEKIFVDIIDFDGETDLQLLLDLDDAPYDDVTAMQVVEKQLGALGVTGAICDYPNFDEYGGGYSYDVFVTL